MKLKRCKLCGGEPKYVYYALPREDCPDQWYETEDGDFEPYVLLKRLECSNCGATTPRLHLDLDGAVINWNEQKILVRYGEEKANDVEGDKDARDS